MTHGKAFRMEESKMISDERLEEITKCSAVSKLFAYE